MPFEIAPKTEQQERTAVGRIALGAIAERVMELDSREFNMANWVSCAMGACRTMPEVTATGLRFVFDYVPAYRGLNDYEAISAAFGVPQDDIESLFAPWGYVTAAGVSVRPDRVAKKIRAYLASSHR